MLDGIIAGRIAIIRLGVYVDVDADSQYQADGGIVQEAENRSAREEDVMIEEGGEERAGRVVNESLCANNVDVGGSFIMQDRWAGPE